MAAIYVLVYLDCDPVDTPHWCLYTVDDDDDELIFEALGSSGTNFSYKTYSVNMDNSTSESQKVRIGRIEADIWSEIPSLFAGVPVSTQAGWNCQNWVMEAISALKGEGFLEEDEGGVAYIHGKYQKKRATY